MVEQLLHTNTQTNFARDPELSGRLWSPFSSIHFIISAMVQNEAILRNLRTNSMKFSFKMGNLWISPFLIFVRTKFILDSIERIESTFILALRTLIPPSGKICNTIDVPQDSWNVSFYAPLSPSGIKEESKNFVHGLTKTNKVNR